MLLFGYVDVVVDMFELDAKAAKHVGDDAEVGVADIFDGDVAAMPMKEPTSIMSGSMVCSVPWRVVTPSMVSRLEPMPEMLAPMELSMWHSCWMYGSQAAL